MIRRHEFFQAMRRHIERRGCSQHDAAIEIGISPSSVSRIVNNFGVPDFDNLHKCCDWMGVPAARFIETDQDVIIHAKDQDKLEIIIDLILRDPEIPKRNKYPFVEIFKVAYKALANK